MDLREIEWGYGWVLSEECHLLRCGGGYDATKLRVLKEHKREILTAAYIIRAVSFLVYLMIFSGMQDYPKKTALIDIRN
jgi:hypothetical protein